MTLFIILTATTNIVLGYALAVYFGQGQLPWRIKRSNKKCVVAKPVEDVSETLEREDSVSENPALDPSSLAKTVEQRPQESVEPASIKAAAKAEPAPAESVKKAPLPEEQPMADPVEAASAVSDRTEDSREENLQDSEPLGEAKESPTGSKSEVADEAAESSSEPIDEKFLDGIEAFQNQLNESQMEEEASPDSEVVTTEDSTPGSEEGDPDELLAGIESFRAQLAGMQNTDEPSAEGTDPAEAEDTEEAEALS